MDIATFRAIHRYGAILSVVAIVGAILAAIIGGPLSVLVFPLGFFGPLCAFYFLGAVLEEHPTYDVLGEELLRGIVWYGGSLVGWSLLLVAVYILSTAGGVAIWRRHWSGDDSDA